MRKIVVAAALMLLAAGCKNKVRSSRDVARVMKAFPYTIELFTPAELKNSSNMGRGLGDKYPWFHWNFKTDAAYATVVDFYDQRLGGAQRETEPADDEEEAKEPLVKWTFKPAGAEDADEEVCLSVQKVRLVDKPYTQFTVAWSADPSRFPPSQH